jgi:hypothetical protein
MVPFWCLKQNRSTGSGSDGPHRRGGRFYRGTRVLACRRWRAAREWTVARFWWFPGMVEMRTVFGKPRRARIRGRGSQSCPAARRESDWSGSAWQWPSGGVSVVVLRHNKISRRVQQVHWEKGKRIGGEGGAPAHWFGHNRRNTATMTADSGGRFWAAWGLSGWIGGGETERREQLFL